ncbi:dihydrolipoyllysine-residue acetyltransferase [Tepidiphilus thermophilus]|jgi:pyruvate dehydrogenase E2 component (dihydrolipoamide acetyltransferase)|uniref:Acetyltransferase component of pyruvate dehydrogenase complex n=1 Tax=Tepidiphilus thermophilus TaxID=876478 RepID=A0A0K6IVZ0_9PROT|nr:dihydrolipoyllysine-residue acetyltransferase [Tepidiphilus thermophilus]CUB07290.1 pyruvate dehydrogenase complex dihydrolipoamide acetyltransferase, long form [Tepidiphilus thermophilus]
MASLIEVKVPDIGDYHDVPVIEVLVKPGDVLAPEDPICTLESDKATMDVPCPVAGVVREVLVKVGDKVSEGTPIVRLEASEAGKQAEAPAAAAMPAEPRAEAATPAPATAGETPSPAEPTRSAPAVGTTAWAPVAEPAAPSPVAPTPIQLGGKVHASPVVRAFARELGVDLSKVTASGPNGRILREDVLAYVKRVMQGEAESQPKAGGGTLLAGLELPPWPKVDFAKFGPIEVKELGRIKKISAANLARNWIMIPAVTYHDEADVTELEAFRRELNREHEKEGIKFTMLAFLIKAAVAALQRFPDMNTSLDGDKLVYKRYYHIGFAADTPQGLVVPVLKEADKKGLREIAVETAELARKAREGKLKPAEMQGATFTISSLGGIGGTGFAPIINAPEVAILGVNKIAVKPVWDGKAFVPRQILPLSLTADHRVIDGAYATRFTTHLAQLLADFRRVLL